MKRIIWETYFDDSATRKQGRRVRKGFPKEKLLDIIRDLGLNYTVSEAKYPRQPFKKVKKIEIEYEGSKEELIKKIENMALSKK
ncbi:MAG: signal recognition particle subunit SRP19/SEC65 family protein [Thermoplasmatales archaeon]